MTVVACLAWFMEPPAFLARCVGSLKGVADHIVAYDGGWELFPDATPESTPQEWTAITSAANDAGIPVTIYAPDTAWASQVEKRAALMAEASQLGDWLLVIDGDEWIAGHADPFRRTLEAVTELDVALVMCKRTTGYEGVNTPQRIRRIYRAPVTVDTAHNGYRTHDGRWLHGDGAAVKLEPACDLSSLLLIHHARLDRGPERNRKALDYRTARMQLKAEDWRTLRTSA